ncbi:MAG TPA: Ldh family oxidoreductase [Sneathiellales bacterium]|nr:Ldh family oxidoreductase [Sneathiellales bacterium]
MKIEDAEALVAKALMANMVSERNALSVARALVAAEVDGQSGHGFARVAAYSAQARSGKVVGAACPFYEHSGATLIRVDARNGFAYPAIELAIDELASLAKRSGIAAAAIANSHHCGQLGAHVEKLAERGLVALMVANTPRAMAPWGGNKPLFGTNPIAFAAPRNNAEPIVIDLSLSKIARGKVMAAKKRGEPIPEGWALDSDGNPTTDADAALAGMMLPAGDAKGSALALIVEILAATMTGANYSYEATSFFDAEGKPPGVGQFMIAINPNGALGLLFGERLEELVAEIEGQGDARLPGARRLVARAKCAEQGVFIAGHLLDEIERTISL